ncbi:ATP-dependent DNA helicase PcrA (plasmid) [Gulosibacter molinativorax]|nr:ATP-dependent DNA helicase PcrA [Gulosibacter molinativorax]
MTHKPPPDGAGGRMWTPTQSHACPQCAQPSYRRAGLHTVWTAEP